MNIIRTFCLVCLLLFIENSIAFGNSFDENVPSEIKSAFEAHKRLPIESVANAELCFASILGQLGGLSVRNFYGIGLDNHDTFKTNFLFSIATSFIVPEFKNDVQSIQASTQLAKLNREKLNVGSSSASLVEGIKSLLGDEKPFFTSQYLNKYNKHAELFETIEFQYTANETATKLNPPIPVCKSGISSHTAISDFLGKAKEIKIVSQRRYIEGKLHHSTYLYDQGAEDGKGSLVSKTIFSYNPKFGLVAMEQFGVVFNTFAVFDYNEPNR